MTYSFELSDNVVINFRMAEWASRVKVAFQELQEGQGLKATRADQAIMVLMEEGGLQDSLEKKVSQEDLGSLERRVTAVSLAHKVSLA